MKYKIVCLKNPLQQLARVYPSLISKLYQPQDNPFKTKQVELNFQSMAYGKEKLLNFIQSREDYSYYHGVHQINNSITHETILIHMNEYDIEVEEPDQQHSLYDVMSGFSANFYMIVE